MPNLKVTLNILFSHVGGQLNSGYSFHIFLPIKFRLFFPIPSLWGIPRGARKRTFSLNGHISAIT